MQNIIVRKAVENDCQRMLYLITELAIYEKEPEAVTVSLAHFIKSGFGPNAVWTAFVAEVNGQIEGFALMYIRYSTWKGQMLYLEDFYVTQEMRKHGLGKMLFDRVLAYGKEQGHCGVTWQVLDWNQVAIDFYNKYPTVFDKEWWNGKIFF